MADEDLTYDDRAELVRVESELAEIDRDIRQVRESLSDGGPMDPEDRSTALTQIEELETVRGRLRDRRDALAQKLGPAG